MKLTWVFAPRLATLGLSFTHHAAYPWYVRPNYVKTTNYVAMTELDRAFQNLAKQFLAQNPLPHEWRDIRSRINGNRVDLICAPDTPNEVFASLLGWQIVVGRTRGDHDDFEDFGRDISDEQLAREALDRFVEILVENGHLQTS